MTTLDEQIESQEQLLRNHADTEAQRIGCAILASLRELAAIKSAEMPEEPWQITEWRKSGLSDNVIRYYGDIRAFALRMKAEADLLRAIGKNYWMIDPVDHPTGGGDADVGWRVCQYVSGKSGPQTIAEVFEDDPAAAIRAAIDKERGK